MKFSTLWISVLGALLLVIFAVQNTEPLTIKFWPWNIEGSQALVIMISVILGLMISFIFTMPSYYKKNREIRRLKDEIRALKSQEGNKTVPPHSI